MTRGQPSGYRTYVQLRADIGRMAECSVHTVAKYRRILEESGQIRKVSIGERIAWGRDHA